MVFQPDGRVDQVIAAELKLLHDAQAVRQGFLQASSIIGWRQLEQAVALQRLCTAQRQGGRKREAVQRGHTTGLGLFLPAGGDGFRVLGQFDELEAAAVGGEGVARFCIGNRYQLLRQIRVTNGLDYCHRRLGHWGRWGCSRGWIGSRKSGGRRIGYAGRKGLGWIKLGDQDKGPKHDHHNANHDADD